MFGSLLIANRGEIACRVIRTARRMGIRTIAIYSDADADSLHVGMADEACHVGGAPAADSYLSIANIIDAVQDTRAEAVHPGYGFLAENAAFAEACVAAGVAFVGPSADAICTMGEKVQAKQVVEAAGVPVLPDYRGTARRRDSLHRAAAKVGFPLLVKASAGGGGRGMRLVENEQALDAAIDGARREAQAAFGDDRVFLEKYLACARHVEVQVFGDRFGQVIHLFERDCSAQRRHQKLVEEAPAPGLSPALRRSLGEAAVAAAEAVRYCGAGTVEFLVDPGADGGAGAFYFLEMNTRLQVEHPVTEMVTGLDLVEWQLRVAAGEPLPRSQSEIRLCGHAIEARLYAEDPARRFLPGSGRLEMLQFPDENDALRIETGVREGDSVSRHYDTMLAKLVAFGADRGQAIDRLRGALAETVVAGPATNKAFLAAILRNPAFASGRLDTQCVERNEAELIEEALAPADLALALAGFAERWISRGLRRKPSQEEADRFSPWDRLEGWRLFGHSGSTFHFRDGSVDRKIAIDADGMTWFDDRENGQLVQGKLDADGAFVGLVDGKAITARILACRDTRQVSIGERCRRLNVIGDAVAPSVLAAGGGILTAPLPANVVAVHVRPGQRVARGEALMVLEAMKMEHVISAPDDGTIVAVHYTVGAQVDEGAQLIGLETGGGSG